MRKSFRSLIKKSIFGFSFLILLFSFLYFLNLRSMADQDDSVVISISDEKAKAGAEVDIQVSIKNNPGILGATLRLEYDSKLTLLEAKSGEAFKALTMTKPGRFSSPCNFVWDAESISEQDRKDGVILSLKFKVSEMAQNGDILPVNLSYSEGGIIDADLNTITATIEVGKITIGEESLPACGIKSAEFVSGKTNLVIKSDRAVNAVIVVASYYDGTGSDIGKMADQQIHSVDLSAGDNKFSYEIEFKGAVRKVFLLTDTFKPLCTAKDIFENAEIFMVTFLDWDGSVICERTIPYGGDAELPADPKREGFSFAGWEGNYTNVKQNETVTAKYTDISGTALEISSVNAKPGDTNVSVTVSIRNNPGILGMKLKISYDESVLTLTGAENGEAFSEILALTKSKTLTNGCNFVWDGVEVSESQIKDGAILKLIFSVKGSAVEGSYPITFTAAPGETIDNNLSAVDMNIGTGYINIIK